MEGHVSEIDLSMRNVQNSFEISCYSINEMFKKCITEYEDIGCPRHGAGPERYILSTTEDTEDETVEAGNVTYEGNRYYNTQNEEGVGTHNQSTTEDNEGETIEAGEVKNDDEEDADGYLCPHAPVIPSAARSVGTTDSTSPDKEDDCPTTNTPIDD